MERDGTRRYSGPVDGDAEILTADEVAQLLRDNRKTVYEAVHAGNMPGVIRLGRVLRFIRSEVLVATPAKRSRMKRR